MTRERSGTNGKSASFRRAAGIALINLVIIILLFTLLEGAASIAFVAHTIIRAPAAPQHEHAEHDAALGWVNLPNVDLPNFYGPGAGVQTNSQRFRSAHDFPRTVPEGKLRIVCSGDSFSFGYGVANDETWCAGLTMLDPRLETVNMGVNGYGVDQTFLRYRRDGTRLEHQLQLLSLITDDFNRMRSDRFLGYGKPLLAVRTDSLVVTNLPVPRTSGLEQRRRALQKAAAGLSVVRLARRVLGADRGSRSGEDAQTSAGLRMVVAHILTDLRRLNEAQQSRLVVVYLPADGDHRSEPATDAWRAFVRAEAERQGVAFIDLVDEIRSLPAREIDRLYAPNLHFTVAGNEWAAEALYRRLKPMLDSLHVNAPRPGST